MKYVLHDQDSHDCKQLKQQLKRLCDQNNKHKLLIRIVCRELEAWYFGDLDAVEKAFPSFAEQGLPLTIETEQIEVAA